MIFLRFTFFSCLLRVRRLRRRGRPALIRVESCRVKTVRTLAGTLPVALPPPMEKLREKPFPLDLAAAEVSAMLVGNCPCFLMAAAASAAWLASTVPWWVLPWASTAV